MPAWSLFLVGCMSVRGSFETDDSVTADSDAVDSDSSGTRVRIVTWNIEGLGRSNTDGYQAVLAILMRLDADIIAINEVESWDLAPFRELADALGHEVVLLPEENPFGDLRNAMMARLLPMEATTPTSAELSGDPDANELTRLPLRARFEVGGTELVVVGQHWKSGFEDADEFRRAVDAQRTAQALDVEADLRVAMGDVNAEIEDGPGWPETFDAIPAGMPPGYWVGADLYAAIDTAGLPNDAFAPFTERGLQVVDALQADGRPDTRWESGRRIDRVMVDRLDLVVGSEVYDSKDEQLEGLDKAGEPPPRESTEEASDHLPIVVDLMIP